MRLLRFILVFAIGWSLAVLPRAGDMAMAETDHMAMPDSTPTVSELTVGSAHDCCDKGQAPADHMKNCQATAACGKCFNFLGALLSAPIIHPPLIKAELWLTPLAIFSSPNHPPFRPPRA